MFVENCDFCLEFASHNTWLSGILHQEGLADRILVRKNGVITLVGLGPLVPGYVLIVPEVHYYSICEVPESLLSEVSIQKDQAINVLAKEFGSAICFEHGVRPDTKRGEDLPDYPGFHDHAHIHVIPGGQGFREYISTDFEEITLRGLSDLKQSVGEGGQYLFLEDFDRRCYVYKPTGQIPTHYLRRIWAKMLDRPGEWNWALFSNYDLMKITYSLMKDKLLSLG